MSDATVIQLTAENFNAEVLESDRPVLVDFWAAWCGPCRMISPIVEALAQEFVGQVKFGKLNIDDYPHLATRYSVQAVPTLLVFQGGRPIQQIVGVSPQPAIAAKLNAILYAQAPGAEQAA